MVITLNFTKLEITERSKIKFIDPFSSRNILQGEKFERKTTVSFGDVIFLNNELPRKNEVNICGGEKKMMTQWRHCTDALQMQRARAHWVHRPSPVPSPRAPAASDVIVRRPSPSHPGFHENNDVTVSGPWIHLAIPGRWTDIRGFYRTSPWLVAFCARTNGPWNKTTRPA